MTTPARSDARPVIIDTNRVLDLWLFDDPQVAALKQVVQGGAVRWLATAAMRAELARVLGYAAVTRQLQRRQCDGAPVLAAFDAWAQVTPAAPAAGVRCADRDDQMFIDLALAWRAELFSKDREVLALARPLAPLGVAVRAGDWAGSYQK